MADFERDLADVPEHRRPAAKWFLRLDYGMGRLVHLGISAVLVLAALMFAGFALIDVATGDRGRAVGGFVPTLVLLVVAWLVGRRRARRFTDMDLS